MATTKEDFEQLAHDTVIEALRNVPLETLENILEWRRREEPGIATGPARLRVVRDEEA